jgi:hypothetical protein
MSKLLLATVTFVLLAASVPSYTQEATGQYTIGEQSQDGLKATARVDTAASPALPGTDRVYFMKVEGSKLTMKSPGVIEPMTGVTSALMIELVKAE